MKKIKFRPDADELVCGADCEHHATWGWMACMRRDGHDGDHIAMVGDAARADGVEHCCRIPLGSTEHRADCWRLIETGNNDEE